MILQLLDVLIGLTLVYLIFSTAASIAVELLETRLRRRGRMLERGIAEILTRINGGAGVPDDTAVQAMVRQFYESPFVYSLYEGAYTPQGSKLPSAIPSTRFVGALLALAEQHATFRDAANTMLKTSGLSLGDSDAKVRAALAAYFDESMARVTGWYRRHTQTALLAIGAVIAVAVNADTLQIVRTLSQDDALRAKIVATAINMPSAAAPTPPVCDDATLACEQKLAQRVGQQLALAENLGLPLGWHGAGLPACMPPSGGTACSKGQALLQDALFVASKVIGLALTALATTLGAPFWFELLKGFIRTRNVAEQATTVIEGVAKRRRTNAGVPRSAVATGRRDPDADQAAAKVRGTRPSRGRKALRPPQP